MALKFQYNKTYMQQLTKALRVRENALPTLEAKEAALRLEVKRARQEVAQIEQSRAEQFETMKKAGSLWCEFPKNLIKVSDVVISIKKIAGVKTPVLEKIKFSVADFSLFGSPSWFPSGIEAMQRLVELTISKEVAVRRMQMLEYARKKTTQKVNLYEKVQIPEYREAILKIKRFLEDEDNLAKSSQKILKERLAAAEAAI